MGDVAVHCQYPVMPSTQAVNRTQGRETAASKALILLVGASGFEPETSCAQVLNAVRNAMLPGVLEGNIHTGSGTLSPFSVRASNPTSQSVIQGNLHHNLRHIFLCSETARNCLWVVRGYARTASPYPLPLQEQSSLSQPKEISKSATSRCFAYWRKRSGLPATGNRIATIRAKGR